MSDNVVINVVEEQMTIDIGFSEARGPKGDPGVAGPTGPQGIQGIQGIAGTNGTSGSDGREIELQNNSTYVQWRYVGDVSWNNLVLVSELKGDTGEIGPQGIQGVQGVQGVSGDDGKEIELQNNSTYVQWRYVGDINWNNLILISDLKGEKGDQGDAGDSVAIGWINVVEYGAVGDGVTDDTAAIANAIAALPVTGGVLYFPPGSYSTSGGFVLAVPTQVLGGGMCTVDGSGAVSEVLCTSPTASLFLVTGRKAKFADISLKNTSVTPPTAGAGITVAGSYALSKVDYDHLSIFGFWIDIDVQVGECWTANNLYILYPVKYGMRIRNTVNGDAGDWSITNSDFFSGTYASDAAIRIESSGGGKISNIKINADNYGADHYFLHGIDVQPSATTSIFMITNSSIENIRGNGINFIGGGNLPYVVLSGLQFGFYGQSGYPILMSGTSYVVIMGCIFAVSGAAAAISLTNCNSVFVSGCIPRQPSTLVEQTGCSGVVIDTGETGSGVTEVDTGTGLTGGPITSSGTLALADTAVSPGSYSNANITVDAQGRITAAENGSASGSTIQVKEVDNSPTLEVTEIIFPNGTLTDNGGGSVTYTPAPGEGDGDGAPTTTPYITAATDAGLSAEIVIPGLAGSPDQSGAAGEGTSEEYDTTTTGLTWTPSAPATINSHTDRLSHLHLAATDTTDRYGQKAWTPVGAFDARCKISFWGGANATLGLSISNSDNTTHAIVDLSMSSAITVVSRAFTYASSTWTQRGNSFNWDMGETFLRITRDEANNVTFFVSRDGYVWNQISTLSFSFTVAWIGIHCSGAAFDGYVDWLRTNV